MPSSWVSEDQMNLENRQERRGFFSRLKGELLQQTQARLGGHSVQNVPGTCKAHVIPAKWMRDTEPQGSSEHSF